MARSLLWLLSLMVPCTLVTCAPAAPPAGTFLDEVHNDIVKQLQNESVADPDPVVGIWVDMWRPGSSSVNPEELGNYCQGDMLIPRTDTERSGIFGIHYRWPDGIVYYYIQKSDFTAAQLELIQHAIDEYHRVTCIRFKPYTGKEHDYVHIQSEKTGCWSAVGRIGGKQILNLQSPGCLYYIGTTIHELMHALGFYHEQSRTDREDFITIAWNNIKDRALGNFREQPSIAFGVPYDYGSVMHYSAYAFSKNHERTIITKHDGKRIGQRFEFSPLDIQKVRAMYCPNKMWDPPGTSPNSTSSGNNTTTTPRPVTTTLKPPATTTKKSALADWIFW